MIKSQAQNPAIPNYAGEPYPGQNRTSTYISITLKAGEVYPIVGAGEAYQVVTTTGVVHISTSVITAARPYISKQGERFTDGLLFNYMELENKNPQAIVVVLWYGFGYYIDNTQNWLPNPTKSIGTATTTLAPSTGVNFTGVPPTTGKYIQRAALFVSNLDPNLPLLVRDANGLNVVAVMALTSVQIEDSGPLEVYNPNGTLLNVAVGESWYIAN